jgi:hypothetical protein
LLRHSYTRTTPVRLWQLALNGIASTKSDVIHYDNRLHQSSSASIVAEFFTRFYLSVLA